MSGAALDFRILTREALAFTKKSSKQGSFQNMPPSTLLAFPRFLNHHLHRFRHVAIQNY